MTTALVLSGGGAKGSFEVGALQYLYENGFLANVICSTSVGSVNAIQLAHGGTKDSQKAAFDTLKTIWQTELTFNQDMYVEAPWFQDLTGRTRANVVRLLSISPPSFLNQVMFFPPYVTTQAVALGVDIIEVIIGFFMHSSSFFTLDPIRAKLVKYLNAAAVANSGVELRLVAVSLDSGAIRYITQDGRVLETDGTPVAGANPTVCAAERDAYNAAVDARMDLLEQSHTTRTDLSEELKRAVAEVARARTRLGQCMTASAAAGIGNRLVVDVADGVIASASISCAFPPVVLGNESYVDGGVRWVLPLKAALDFDTDSIVAINASPAGVPPARFAYRNADLVHIAERSVLDILLWEIQERHLEAAKVEALQRRQKVWVVTPRVDVHDTLTIDPGLIDINIAYGYMRAADVMTAFAFEPPVTPTSITPIGVARRTMGDMSTGAADPFVSRSTPTRTEGLFVDDATDQVQASLADAIARCRRRCWEVEHNVFGARFDETPFAPRGEIVGIPWPEMLDEVRLLKSLLGMLVAARQQMGGKLPSDATTWADNWERHKWRPADVPGVGNTPWEYFISVAGDRAAGTRPTAMIVKAPDKDEVFLLDPTKHWITSPAALDRLDSRGFAAVEEVPAEYLDAIPRAGDISLSDFG